MLTLAFQKSITITVDPCSSASATNVFFSFKLGRKKQTNWKTVPLGTFHFLLFRHPHSDIQAEHSYSLSEGDSAPQSPALSIKMDQESGGCPRLLFPPHLFCVSNVLSLKLVLVMFCFSASFLSHHSSPSMVPFFCPSTPVS